MTLVQHAAAAPAGGIGPDAGTCLPRTFLLCRAGGRACGLASGGVMEVMPAAPSAALPGVASPVLGLIPVRGAVVPVFDLAAALSALVGSAAGQPGSRRMSAGARVHVLLRDGARLAVAAVDEVGELFELPTGGGVTGMPLAGATRPAPLWGEIWRHAERVLLLDAAALLRAPATALVAGPSPGTLSTSTDRR